MIKASRLVVTPSASSAELLPGGSLKPVHLRGGHKAVIHPKYLKKIKQILQFFGRALLKGKINKQN